LVDERQAANAIGLAETVCEEEGLQYIVAMNSDDLAKIERLGRSFQASVIDPRLTDAYEDGGLFGFVFD